MRFLSLIHLAKTTLTMSAKERMVVLGSSSLLCFDSNLGEPGQPLETSIDADFMIEGCDEELAKMLIDALGDDSLFGDRQGYYADILRPEIVERLPRGWEERLAPLPGCEGVFCIEPHDLAVAKLQAGRPKDIDLLVALIQKGMLTGDTIYERLHETRMQEKMIIFAHGNLRTVEAAAWGDAAPHR